MQSTMDTQSSSQVNLQTNPVLHNILTTCTQEVFKVNQTQETCTHIIHPQHPQSGFHLLGEGGGGGGGGGGAGGKLPPQTV